MSFGEDAAKAVPVNGAGMYVDGLASEALSTRLPETVRYSDVSDREVNGHDNRSDSRLYDPGADERVETTIRRFRTPRPETDEALGSLGLSPLSSQVAHQIGERLK